jgi:FkbM family methyltransferase
VISRPNSRPLLTRECSIQPIRLAPRNDSAQDLHQERFVNARMIDVRSMRLDDFCKDQCSERIGFLKVDVEGAEVCVMKGAENLLRNRAVELIWIEVEPDNLCEMGDSIDDLADGMKNLG